MNQLSNQSLRVTVKLAVCLLALVFVSLPEFGASKLAAQDSVSFNRDVRPILSNHCFACHGPDEESREADLRLDQAGDIDLEEVLSRIASDDEYDVMPPPEFKKALSKKQIETLKRWVELGGEFEKHWAFQPVAADESSIDELVADKLQQSKRRFNAQADRRTLIRRVTFDLTGLPPTLAEVRAFASDRSEDAYEQLVDRLLAKRQFGEHMARYWLDLVRFADTNGRHHDHYRDMTPYRDWVIRSFNDNLPFDDFVQWQIAGDLYEEPSEDQLIASGFNRLHLIIDVGTALPEESFHRNVVDRVTSVGTAFMGMTVQCAECHDHKYDPISQKEFYQLYAFFDNFDGQPETGGRRGNDFLRGLQQPYIELPTEQQAAKRKQLNDEMQRLIALLKPLREKEKLEKEKAEAKKAAEKKGAEPKAAADAKETDPKTDDAWRKELEKLAAEYEATKKQRDAVEVSIPAALVMKERSEVRKTQIRVRGQYDDLGPVVQRDTPAVLPALEKRGDVASRLDLANWMVADENPLTARVAVNRIWQQFFGVGLVKTSEDFGAQGETPSHPKLLDHLANEFVRSEWNTKQLVRSIVLSKTYKQSSVAETADFESDPENRMLGRGSRVRLDAEMIRDQVLAVSGLLNESMHGKSVKPPQPKGLWLTVAMPSSYPREYVADTGDQIFRRSVYTFWKRAMPPPQMTIFDAPTREACIARRERTNTPLQALLLMNEQQYFDAAMHLTQKVINDKDLTNDEQRLSHVYESITSQVPKPETLKALQDGLQQFQNTYRNNPELAKQMLQSSRFESVGSIKGVQQQANFAAWTMLVHSLLNLDTTKTRE